MQQAVAMSSHAEHKSYNMLIPMLAMSYWHAAQNKPLIPKLNQASLTEQQFPKNSCPVDKIVSVVAPHYHQKTLEVFLANHYFWQSSGQNTFFELKAFHLPYSMTYVGPDGHCHQHWIIQGSAKQNTLTDIDPGDPENSNTELSLNDKSEVPLPFNVTRSLENHYDLDPIENPLTNLFPDPYPLTIKYSDSGIPVSFQDSIWLRMNPEESIILLASEFPAVVKVSHLTDETRPQFIAAESIDNATGNIHPVFRLYNKIQAQVSEDPLLRFLALIYGAAFHVLDNNGQSSYIIHRNGKLVFISQAVLRLWLSRYRQSRLESLYPEIFGPQLPAGGGWHEWNRYVRKKPVGEGQSRKGGNPGDRNRNRNDAHSARRPVPVKNNALPQDPARQARFVTSGKTGGKPSIELREISEQLKNAEQLCDAKEYDRSIGVLIRTALRMNSANIDKRHDLRKKLNGILNKAILKQMKTHVFGEAKRNNHQQAIQNLRALKIIPFDMLSEGHIVSMESAAHVSGIKLFEAKIDGLHKQLNAGADENQIRQKAMALYQSHRQVLSEVRRNGLAIAWCQSLRPLLDEISELQNNEPLRAFNKLGPNVIPYVDLLGSDHNSCTVTRRRVRAILPNVIDQTLTALEQDPTQLSRLLEFRIEWVLITAKQKRLIDETALEKLTTRLSTLQQSYSVSPEKHFQIRFRALYEQNHSEQEAEHQLKGSVLYLMNQVDNYLTKGDFGKAMGLIIAIHKETKNALPYGTKARLYNQLRAAAYPLLYDLTLVINARSALVNVPNIFNELKSRLGELDLQLAASQVYSLSWMGNLFVWVKVSY
ncbi:hypothetical protein GZ77_01955 [Endozoicomonas montiporae]|uniref:Uncharacterized protein n=3 Tax=Endozoicomonas montiporae TaxID=1027273 RepID=A0A081NAG2_9GAMM|nr:hypothetical protein GZ77_01955 [Endozoicomonas montiporae]